MNLREGKQTWYFLGGEVRAVFIGSIIFVMTHTDVFLMDDKTNCLVIKTDIVLNDYNE